MNWFALNWSSVYSLAVTHVALALPAILAALLLAVPLGRLATSYPRIGGPLLSAFALVYALPSLPLLVVVPVIIGTGLRDPINMVAVLTLYGVAILVGQCARAFRDLPPDVIESADAMGMGVWRRFYSVELPLALPVVMSGLRVVTASTVSLVTVGAVIGVKSLGTLFTDGFQRGLIAEVVTGVVATVLLALALDLLIVLLTRVATPWRHTGGGRR